MVYLYIIGTYSNFKRYKSMEGKGWHLSSAHSKLTIFYTHMDFEFKRNNSQRISKKRTPISWRLVVKRIACIVMKGPQNDVKNGVVLLFCIDTSMEPKNMRCFLSTNTELTTEQILTYYSHSWSIEAYSFRFKGSTNPQCTSDSMLLGSCAIYVFNSLLFVWHTLYLCHIYRQNEKIRKYYRVCLHSNTR